MKYSTLTKTLLSAALLSFPLTAVAEQTTVNFPALGGTLARKTQAHSVEAGPIGDVHVGGILSGLAFYQNHRGTSDRKNETDISNGQVFVQKNSGLVQFYAQAGGYSFPTLGTAYTDAHDTVESIYGAVPIAYATLAPTDKFSISVGKLPTLIGYEYGFTFQNANIQRGLLWNQENVVTKGVQANYVDGPLSVAVSWTDGFYSNDYNWLSGLITYTINDSNSIAFSGGGNLGVSRLSNAHTPVAQNNSDIYSLIYTHKADKWTFSPYVQYTFVKERASLGLNDDAQTVGGALIATYQYDDNISFAGRGEYITSDGNVNLTSYGNESDAWTLTFTPTYQKGAFFTRAEASYVGLDNETAGSAFGKGGRKDNQARLLLEAGFLF